MKKKHGKENLFVEGGAVVMQPRYNALIDVCYDTKENYKLAYSLLHRITFRIMSWIFPGFIKIKAGERRW